MQDAQRYDPVARLLHWLTVLLIVLQFSIAWTMPEIHRGVEPTGLIGWHLSVGVAILAVVLVRIGWRVTHSEPAAPTSLSPVLQAISRITHFALYGLLVALPFLGWANASARGWAVMLFGTIPLPQLVAKGSALGQQMGDVHQTAALVLLASIALHVLGAMYHLLVVKDRTVQRML
ncbi:cytochrome b [Sphingomonas sp. 10B4]|uniref:cytochrome b n=1 Tax=Sphingomonas sp. 10B4 TaxID=3048575 RepID=UPI002AB46EED|nr:cytochrome b [Sphingomonas sp. 10B4]MDY7523675.1 cytochrome b [Sphingomonas sp. 10B4]MEB0284570.1 cytochrome b [Sphingomonas sp. 10B4]